MEFINSLELLAILFGLQAACHDFHSCHIKVMTDNMTAVSGMTKQGSTKSERCNEIVRQIWYWAEHRQIWLTAAHIPGVENVVADEESRKFNDSLDWQLDSAEFRKICNEFGKPTLDAFATRLNTQVPRFHSYKPDPLAEAVDTFKTSWAYEYIYAFPPFCLVGKVIQKIVAEKTQGILIAPNWPTKNWFSMLNRACISEIIEIPVTNTVLSLPYNRKMSHPMRDQLMLIACVLSGESCNPEDTMPA